MVVNINIVPKVGLSQHIGCAPQEPKEDGKAWEWGWRTGQGGRKSAMG